jgi:hypothetical protein
MSTMKNLSISILEFVLSQPAHKLPANFDLENCPVPHGEISLEAVLDEVVRLQSAGLIEANIQHGIDGKPSKAQIRYVTLGGKNYLEGVNPIAEQWAFIKKILLAVIVTALLIGFLLIGGFGRKSPVVAPVSIPTPTATPESTPTPTPSPEISPITTATPIPTPEVTPAPTPSPTPSPSVSPKPKPKPQETPRATPSSKSSASPKPKSKESSRSNPTPKPSPSISPKPKEKPHSTPVSKPTPSASPKPKPKVTPHETPEVQ